ncbi:MAG TPA: SDR family NAD(P)-dependent oxidoreductase [Roseiarcus sp.]|nr:SDR family NAD(P)-dependent oxidoreductase [Roseiarcus sp.]
MELRGKAIVIMGAARGLGRKMAERIAAEGAKIALVDLDPEMLQEAKRACSNGAAEVRDYVVEVTDEGAVEALFQDVRNDFGAVDDGLINNAGTTSDALQVKAVDGKVVSKMTTAEFDKVIAVDLRGVFLCGREAAVHMVEGGRAASSSTSPASPPPAISDRRITPQRRPGSPP